MPEPIPPTVLTMAPVWKGVRKGFRAVMEVAMRANSMAPSVRMPEMMVELVGLGFCAGAR